MKILLIILAALLLLLLIPVRVRGSYRQTPKLDISYLFFKKRILPKPERRAKPQKTEETKPAEKAADKPRRPFPLTVSDMLELLPKAVERLLPPVRRLLKRTVVARFSLELVVVGSDAADTAVKFGRANAAVVNAVALLDRVMTLKAERVDIFPGFTAEQSEIGFSAEVRAYPLAVLTAAVQLAVSALILLIPALIRRKRKNKADKARLNQINDRKDDHNGEQEPVGRSA